MTKIIGVLSGKGGVGKTTLVANLGVAFSQFNRVPLLVDANMRAPSLGLHLGAYEDLPNTLKDIIRGEIPITHAIYKHPIYDLRYLPAPMKGDVADLRNLDRILQKLENYNPIVVDTAPAFSEEAIESLRAINQGLVVTTPRLPAITDAMRTIKLLRKAGKRILGIVLNKTQGDKIQATREEVEESCGEKVIAKIPMNKKVLKSVEEGNPIVASYPYSKPAIAFKQLAADILNIHWRPPGLLERIKNLFKGERSSYYTR